jgi:hypothetical protein
VNNEPLICSVSTGGTKTEHVTCRKREGDVEMLFLPDLKDERVAKPFTLRPSQFVKRTR